jgi:hypothetical protein
LEIQNNLESIAKGDEPNNYRMVEPLIDSSYPVKYMNRTFTENAIIVTVVVILSFWIIWYLYKVQFFEYLFNIILFLFSIQFPDIVFRIFLIAILSNELTVII